MEKVVHVFLLITTIGWPVTLIATSVVLPPLALVTTAAMLTFALFSIRFFKSLFRQALDSFRAEENF